jgi:excisionase family DNA binding protein
MLGWRPRDLVGVAGYDLAAAEPTAVRRARVQLLDSGDLVENVTTLVARNGDHFRYAYSARTLNEGEFYIAAGAELLSALVVGPTLASDPEWLDRKEAAAIAHCSARTLQRRINEGSLRVSPTTGLIHRDWLESWLGGDEIVARLNSQNGLPGYDEQGVRAWLTLAEAAQVANVSHQTIRRAIADRQLQSAKVGRNVRIHRSWLDAWLSGGVLVVVLLYVLLELILDVGLGIDFDGGLGRRLLGMD